MFSLALAAEPAGASTYDVSTVSSNWIATTGHTVISAWAAGICPDTIGDDSLSAPLDLGFSFRLGATSFTQLRVSTNGRVQFNNTYCRQRLRPLPATRARTGTRCPMRTSATCCGYTVPIWT